MTVIIVLSIIGIVAILLELLLPGGILGVLGAVALIVAASQVFADYGATAGMIFSFSAFTITVVAFLLWMKYFHLIPFAKSFILHEAVGGEDGSGDKSVGTDPALVGKRGVTVTDLQPSGRARIDGERHDVVAESGAIDKGTEIEVVAINPIPVVRVVA
jgi:membrane-bound serine protease (ClpP class)